MNVRITYLIVMATVMLGNFTFLFSLEGKQQSTTKSGKPTYIKNMGQWDKNVQYLAKTPNMDVWVTESGITFDAYSFVKGQDGTLKKGTVITMDFHKEKPLVSTSDDLSTSVFNYYYGTEKNWKENVPSFNKVLLHEVYTGIDAVLLFDDTKPRYDFIVKPGANPKDIKFTFSGEVLATHDKDHEVQISTILGSLVNSKLLAYQVVNGEKVTVPCYFDATLTENGVEMSFDVGKYDITKNLVIDPVVYFSFVGTAGSEEIRTIKVASDKSVIVGGWTTSGTFPTTTGSYQELSKGGSTDAFITRLAPNMETILYSTYIGGTGADTINKLVLDVDNNIYCVGTTTSGDYPTSTVAAFKIFGGQSDAFVTKFNFDGTLRFSTLYGGNGIEYGVAIAINVNNEPFITGATFSINLPKTAISVDDSYNGGGDAYIAKFDANGATLITNSYLGVSAQGNANQSPNDFDCGLDIAIGPNGTIHIVGETRSGSFPSMPPTSFNPVFTPFDRSHNGGSDAFITKMQPQASGYLYSTFFGATGEDRAVAVTVTADNQAVVLGTTTSTTSFGAVPAGYQTTNAGQTDFFVTEINTQAKPTSFTYLGSNQIESGSCIQIDPKNGDVYISGSTSSSGIAIIGSDIQTTNSGGTDGYIAQFNSTLSEIKFSTFIGGTGFDNVNQIVVDDEGDVYYAGISSANNVPKTNQWSSYQGIYNGGSSDGIVGKFSKKSITISSPADGSTICPGQNLTMQWATTYPTNTPFFVELSIDNGPFIQSGSPVTVNQFVYLVPVITPSSAKIRLRVRHASGVQATTGELNVGSVPIITVQPTNITVCEGDTIKIQIQATGDGISYEWRKGSTLIPNANTNTLTILNAKLTDAGSFNCTVRGECTPFPVSTNATVTVRRKTSVTSQPIDLMAVVVGSNIEFCVVAEGSNLTYQWYQNGINLGTAIATAQTSCLKINSVNTNFEGKYYCIIRGDCGVDSSRIADLTVGGTGSNDANSPIFASFIMNSNTTGVLTVDPIAQCYSKISLVNSLGMEVMNLQLGTLYNKSTIPLDLSTLTSGLYWISIECGTQRSVIKAPIVR